MKIVCSMSKNGVIRNGEGTLLAHYDHLTKVLLVGDVELLAEDEEHAMDIVGEKINGQS